jgi:iron complex transport system permease protein
MSLALDGIRPSHIRRLVRIPLALGGGALLLLVAVVISLSVGPLRIRAGDVATILFDAAFGVRDAARDSVVVLDVRLPRTVLATLVGAATATAGGILQGLFRNPLADPGLVGVSGGAALAAATWFVYGAALLAMLPFGVGGFGLPLAAFLGGLLVTAILHRVATRDGHTSIVTLLLAGIALAGLTSAMTGLLVFVSSDQQLREFTFWTLGSLGGATWSKIAIVLPFVALLAVVAPLLSRALDAFALGETEAFHLGIPVETVKRLAILAVAAAVGASVAVSGVIGFFGLTVPHLVRLAIGPAHRLLLPASALLGAAILVVADVIARTIASPAEIPLGIITAGVGAPLMLWLLVGRRRGLLG